MEIYIAILRGINVSGSNKIKMDDLRKLFEELNFKNVRTYIQSGNVIFEYKKADHKKLEKLIKEKIFQQFGLNVPVIIRNIDEFMKVIKENPFANNENADVTKLHVTFLSSRPEKINMDKLNDVQFERDQFIISGNKIYLVCPDGYGQTKFHNNFFENKLKVSATTRNWKTINEIIKLANA